MKNAQEAIDKVLAGLRDAEASPGFERRTLAAIEEQSRTRAAAAPQWAWRIGMAGLVALVSFLAITAIHRHGHLSTQAKQHIISPRPLPLAGSAPDRQQVFLPQNQPVAPFRRPASAAVAARNVRQIDTSEAADAALLREMHAPSQPAPEVPLTDEEKLLLRAVHLGDPQVMAMLNPEVRARQEAESEAEFQRFVDQSGKGDSE
jgi:hypothetical protein